jgi:hypothetical protein
MKRDRRRATTPPQLPDLHAAFMAAVDARLMVGIGEADHRPTVYVRVLDGHVTIEADGELHTYTKGDRLTFPFPEAAYDASAIPTTVPDWHVTHRWTKWRVVPSLFAASTTQRRTCVDCDLIQQTPIPMVVRP